MNHTADIHCIVIPVSWFNICHCYCITITGIHNKQDISSFYFLNDDKKPASETFWELEKRIKEDKRHPGVVMELKKSEVIWDIVRLIRLKVITYNDLSDFSDELQNEVKRILEMSR